MLETFYKYLILHHKACIPGIGVFSISRTPARINTEENSLLPPSFHVHFTRGSDMADKRFYTFLEHEQHIDDVPAIRRFNDFACSLKEELYDKKRLQLQQLGTLVVNTSGELEFQPAEPFTQFCPVVPLTPAAQPSPTVLVPVPSKSTEVNKVAAVSSKSHLGGQGGSIKVKKAKPAVAAPVSPTPSLEEQAVSIKTKKPTPDVATSVLKNPPLGGRGADYWWVHAIILAIISIAAILYYYLVLNR